MSQVNTGINPLPQNMPPPSAQAGFAQQAIGGGAPGAGAYNMASLISQGGQNLMQAIQRDQAVQAAMRARGDAWPEAVGRSTSRAIDQIGSAVVKKGLMEQEEAANKRLLTYSSQLRREEGLQDRLTETILGRAATEIATRQVETGRAKAFFSVPNLEGFAETVRAMPLGEQESLFRAYTDYHQAALDPGAAQAVWGEAYRGLAGLGEPEFQEKAEELWGRLERGELLGVPREDRPPGQRGEPLYNPGAAQRGSAHTLMESEVASKMFTAILDRNLSLDQAAEEMAQWQMSALQQQSGARETQEVLFGPQDQELRRTLGSVVVDLLQQASGGQFQGVEINSDTLADSIEKANPVLGRMFREYLDKGRSRVVSGSAPFALTGELGVLDRPDGRVSSELSTTVEADVLNNGRPTNIPLLVEGQVSVDALLAGQEPTRQQIDLAIQRAATRVANGALLPSFDSVKEAVQAASIRSRGGQARSGVVADTRAGAEEVVPGELQTAVSGQVAFQMVNRMRDYLPAVIDTLAIAAGTPEGVEAGGAGYSQQVALLRKAFGDVDPGVVASTLRGEAGARLAGDLGRVLSVLAADGVQRLGMTGTDKWHAEVFGIAPRPRYARGEGDTWTERPYPMPEVPLVSKEGFAKSVQSMMARGEDPTPAEALDRHLKLHTQENIEKGGDLLDFSLAVEPFMLRARTGGSLLGGYKTTEMIPSPIGRPPPQMIGGQEEIDLGAEEFVGPFDPTLGVKPDSIGDLLKMVPGRHETDEYVLE